MVYLRGNNKHDTSEWLRGMLWWWQRFPVHSCWAVVVGPWARLPRSLHWLSHGWYHGAWRRTGRRPICWSFSYRLSLQDSILFAVMSQNVTRLGLFALETFMLLLNARVFMGQKWEAVWTNNTERVGLTSAPLHTEQVPFSAGIMWYNWNMCRQLRGDWMKPFDRLQRPNLDRTCFSSCAHCVKKDDI